MNLPEKDFGTLLSFFSLKNVYGFCLSLGGNCRAFGEVSVISSPEPLADTPLPFSIPSGLFINSLRLTGPANWKHNVIKSNN